MSSQRQGLLPRLTIPAGVFRRGINLWPPFVGAGIKVTRVAADFREIDVRLSLGLLNRNYFGTQFGGSMFAMTDPFWMLLLMRLLGREYYVWDQSGAIDFLKPGRGTVSARFDIDDAVLAEIRQATAGGAKYLHWFENEVVDAGGEVVARVRKQVYVRRKPDRRPAEGQAPTG